MKVSFIEDGLKINIEGATLTDIQNFAKFVSSPLTISSINVSAPDRPNTISSDTDNFSSTDISYVEYAAASEITKPTNSIINATTNLITVNTFEKMLGLKKDRLRHYYKSGKLTTVSGPRPSVHYISDPVIACKEILKSKPAHDLVKACKSYVAGHTTEDNSSTENNTDTSDLLTVSECSKRFNLHPSTLRYHIANGMKHTKRGTRYYLAKDDVTDYLSSHNNKVAALANLTKAHQAHQVKEVEKDKSSTLSSIHANISYATWKASILYKIRNCNLAVSDVLHQSYDRVTRNYGIRWDKLRTEFINVKGDEPTSNLELAYFLDNEYMNSCHNLFACVLDGVLQEIKVNGGIIQHV